jgi:acetyltransferase-like isoleucine patch superfamily enzyme
MGKNKTLNLNKIGKDVFISPLISITRPELISIGNHVAIDPYLHCTTKLEIGDYVHISSHVSIIGGEKGLLKMGNFTNISTGGRIITGSDEFKGVGIVSAPGIPKKFRDKLIIEPIVFEDFVNIGTQVTIFPGVIIPQGVVIGACSLVQKKDVLIPWTIYAGNPLKKIGTRPSEKILKFANELGY